MREKRSFAGAWTNGLLCLVPAASFYEANYEDGAKSVRWRIWLKDEPDSRLRGYGEPGRAKPVPKRSASLC
ncbi:hypothetical protein [Cupriavidus basilensis]|uniref:hypothetical protein n=1 Tax=Cupriavidus basilensis TaxID=68895 RepID=UPI003C2BF744